MHTSNCSHVYLTKCKFEGLPVTLHHCICKTLTVIQNARYVGDKCAYTRTQCTLYSVHYTTTVQNTLRRVQVGGAARRGTLVVNVLNPFIFHTFKRLNFSSTHIFDSNLVDYQSTNMFKIFSRLKSDQSNNFKMSTKILVD